MSAKGLLRRVAPLLVALVVAVASLPAAAGAAEGVNKAMCRLYNRYTGEHFYTTNVGEKNTLVKAGWRDEGIGWYSDDAKTVPLYRQYNPFASTGTVTYTAYQCSTCGAVMQ